MLDDNAKKAIENVINSGYTAEIKVENGNIVVIQKREKRTVAYRGLVKN